MKRKMQWLGALALMMMCAMTLTACGSDGDEEPNGGGQITGISLDDLVGTWEITWSTGYYTENGVKVQEWNESVADEHNRFVIDAKRNVKFMEYDDDGTWHEDGRGTLSNINGVWQCIGEINGKIVSVEGDKMIVEYEFTETKGSVTYMDHYRDTCYRVR